MEVKPSYKQTEVGVIPEEWSIRPLGLICDVRDGTHESPRFFKDGVPFVTSKNIVNGRLDLENVSFISRSDAVEFDKRSKVDRNDILLSMIGTIGSAVLVDCEPDFCIKNVALIKPRKVAPTYLIRLINAPVFQKYLADNLDGGIQKFISLGKLRQLSIPLPDEPEQRAIATALSDVDGLLGGLDRLIAKKRDLKQAAMQQLLTGQTRLPGFHTEWEVKTLFDLAARKKELFDDGDWIESEHITTEGIRLIQTGNIGVGSFVEKDDKKYINEASFASLRCKQLKQGDLLVCRLADPAGRACVLGDIGEERIVTSVDVTIFRPPSELVDRLFLSQVFSTSDWFRAVSDRSGGTTHKRISRGALGRLSINLPSLPEQTAIASVLSEMDTELAVLEQRREKTRALKQAMMQELLTGKTRLV